MFWTATGVVLSLGDGRVRRRDFIKVIASFEWAGGLLAYGPNLLSLYRLAGVLAGKVARGADPAALPIERPTKFETVLNMRTAHALEISIPTSLLLRADEVIE
jgi:putative ABC transport system substrate-binding protein